MSFRSNIYFVALILSLVASSLFAQEGTYVTGTVSDPQGETLIGAYVLLVESGERTVTDPDGKYKIRGALGQTLEFAYMGMITKRIKIRSLHTNVVLEDGYYGLPKGTQSGLYGGSRLGTHERD